MADDAAAANHSTAYLNKTLTVLSCIWWPIGTLLNAIATFVLYLAKLLYWPVGFLLQPAIYLARSILTCLLAPFRLLVKLEVRIPNINILHAKTPNNDLRLSTSISAQQH